MQDDALKLLKSASQLATNINSAGSPEQYQDTLAAIQV
jgi:hypothetical protein